MIWSKYTIKTTTKDADLVSSILMDYGIYDIQIENNVQLTDEELNQMYADFVKELPPDDGTCLIDFYFETDDNGNAKHSQEQKVAEIRAGLKEAEDMFGIEPVQISGEIVDSEDWENKWKEYFKPFLVDDIAIKPTWEKLPEDMKCSTVIDIDPGMAFGTGLHETTRLCLRGIRKYLKEGQTLYDLGCGSGILSIAALKLGAGSVKAVDIDPQATKIAEENFAVNGAVKGSYEVITGNILEDDELKAYLKNGKCSIVAANILAEIIEPLIWDVADYLENGGIFVSSGIICNKEELIVSAVNSNPELELLEVDRDGDWVSVAARRK